MFPVQVQPIIRLKHLIRKLSKAESAIRVRFCDNESRFDALSRQKFVHPEMSSVLAQELDQVDVCIPILEI